MGHQPSSAQLRSMGSAGLQTSLGRRTLLLGSAAFAVALAGCTKESQPSPSANPDSELLVGATIEPKTLDLGASNDAAIPQLLLYNVYETLVKVDATGALKPLLAASWTISDDRLVYTFTLQAGAKFASGTPVDAAAVKQSLEHMKTAPSVAAELAVIEKVEAPEARTLVVTLAKPSYFWLYSMSSTAGVVIDPAGLTSLATKPAGSGPYAFDTWAKGTSITLKKNTSYWGTPPRFSTVTFKYYADPNAMNSAMLAEQLDIISNVAAPQSLDQFTSNPAFTVLEGTTNGEVVLGFNHNSDALKQVKVRQALIHAVDHKALLDTVWNGKGELIGSMVPPTDPWYEDLSGAYPFDPAKAKALLAEAKVKSLTLRLRVPNLPYATAAIPVLTKYYKDIGVTLKSETLTFEQWLQQVYTQGDYDLTIVAHVEPRDLVNWANPQYYWHYHNANFTQLIEQAQAATDPQATDLLKQAAKVLSQDAAADFLFLLPNLIVTRSDISGVAANATSLSFDLTTIASRRT